MAPRKPAAPKLPAIVKRATEVQTGEDLMNLLKNMASRVEFYKPHAAAVSEVLKTLNLEELTDLTDDERTVCKTAITVLANHGFVHPKVGVTIRLLQKEKTNNTSDNEE